MNVRLRFFSYLLTTLVLVLVFFWLGNHTWSDLRQLHRSFTSAQPGDFYIGAHIETTIHELNETVLRIELHQDSADRAAFQKVSQELGEWIRTHQDNLTTPQQRELLGQIKASYEIYLARSSTLINLRAQVTNNPSATLGLAQMGPNAALTLELCGKLKESERAEQMQFMENSQRALTWIQQLLIVVLVVLVSMVGTGVVAIFRGVIGPLQIELTKNRVLAVRNEKLASLGTLAAGVAHEIRNPLTAINVRLHSLKKNLVENSSEQEDALVIGHEIQRLERIVQEFLQFARPAEPKFVIVSADSLLAKVQTLFSSQLEKAAIRLKLESVPDLWVQVDPHQIEQVLINLVKNAAESIESNGTITMSVRTGMARLTGRSRPVVSLEVSDTGKGIPPAVQEHIFDPFFTTKEEGTGLGLVIASRIVEKHNGTLECRSELNRGTTFIILLPKTDPEQINEPTA